MGFIEPKRPLLYFNEEMWELNQKVNINSTSQHVLELNYNSPRKDIHILYPSLCTVLCEE